MPAVQRGGDRIFAASRVRPGTGARVEVAHRPGPVVAGIASGLLNTGLGRETSASVPAAVAGWNRIALAAAGASLA